MIEISNETVTKSESRGSEPNNRSTQTHFLLHQVFSVLHEVTEQQHDSREDVHREGAERPHFPLRGIGQRRHLPFDFARQERYVPCNKRVQHDIRKNPRTTA